MQFRSGFFFLFFFFFFPHSLPSSLSLVLSFFGLPRFLLLPPRLLFASFSPSSSSLLPPLWLSFPLSRLLLLLVSLLDWIGLDSSYISASFIRGRPETFFGMYTEARLWYPRYPILHCSTLLYSTLPYTTPIYLTSTSSAIAMALKWLFRSSRRLPPRLPMPEQLYHAGPQQVS